MEDSALYLYGFVLLNLVAMIFRKPLSKLLMIFFSFGRRMNSHEQLKRKARKMGFEGCFSNARMYNLTENDLRRLIIWVGSINIIGCIGLCYLIHKIA